MIDVRPLALDDHDAWLRLWAGYLRFYRTALADDVTALTWQRLFDPGEPIHGAVAVDGSGAPVGLVHYLYHRSSWSRTYYCYLEDLFVTPEIRGGGYGRALIQHVYDAADAAGVQQVYWLTEDDNQTAQRLYDRIGRRSGFIHYQRPR